MKKLLAALAVSVLGIATVALVQLATNDNVSAVPADTCIKDRGIQYMQGQDRARVEVKLDPGCGTRKLVMKTWYAKSLDDGTQEFHDTQYLMDVGEVVRLTPQSPWTFVKVQIDDKSCFHQIDLVDVTNGDNDGDNKIVTALVGGTKDCRPVPEMSCVDFGVAKGSNRTVTVNKFVYTAKNATLKNVSINWGDNTPATNDVTPIGQTHQFAADGTYNMLATLTFTHRNRVGNIVEKTKTCPASVTFTTEQQAPTYKCEVLNITATKDRKVTISDFKTAVTNGAVYKRAVITWGDGSTTNVTNNAVGQTHTYAKDGSYAISATAYFTVNGQEVAAPQSVGCRKNVTFNPDQPPVVDITVCELSTKKTITIKQSEYDASKHTTDFSKCVVTTAPPTELPNTGPGAIAAIFAGVSSLAGAAHWFFMNRRLG